MRVAVISDIHANEAALDAVLEEIDAASVDAVWCLGDIVGYGPAPNRCCEHRLPRAPTSCLVGNHDLVALGKLDVESFNDDAATAALWTRAELTDESRAFLSPLEPKGKLDGVELFHASARDPIWEYVLSADSALSQPALDDGASRARRPQPRRARDRARRHRAARRPGAGGHGGRARRALAVEPRLGRAAARRRSARRLARARPRARTSRTSIASRIRSSERRRRCASGDCPSRSPSGWRTASRAARRCGAAPHRPRPLPARPLPRRPCRR